jgi:hypothetical protein
VTAAIWVAGAVVLVAAALLPLLAGARRRRRAAATGRDRAEALISALDLAIDRAGAGRNPVPAADLREAERCRTLAGSALAGTPTAADATRARTWAEAGLRALGATDPPPGR